MQVQNTSIPGFYHRKAAKGDETLAKKIIFPILTEYGLSPDPVETDADLENLDRAYEGGFFGFVFNESKEEVGTFGLFKINDEIAEIRKMYLIPAVRGNGLGKWMLTFLLEKAESLGFKQVQLETAVVLKEAINLYKSYGFMLKDAYHISPRCDRAFYLDL